MYILPGEYNRIPLVAQASAQSASAIYVAVVISGIGGSLHDYFKVINRNEKPSDLIFGILVNII